MTFKQGIPHLKRIILATVNTYPG